MPPSERGEETYQPLATFLNAERLGEQSVCHYCSHNSVETKPFTMSKLSPTTMKSMIREDSER